MSSNETFITCLIKNHSYSSYSTTCQQTVSHKVTIKALTNKQVAIYDEELLKKLCDARRIIIHKIASFPSQKRETYFVVIIFEKYEKFLAGLWLITNKVDSHSYETFFKYIGYNFPSLKPEEAIVDYDEDMQHGLRSAFPEIRLIPSFLHQMQEIIEKAMLINTTFRTNRTLYPDRHAVLKKFIALSLLPKNDVHVCYANLVKECKVNYGSYFDLFISYYNEQWIEIWKPEIFCVHQFKDLMKTFLELYGCRKVFWTNTEIEPVILLDKIKTTLIEVRINLFSLEHGDVLPYYLSHEDENMESKLYKTWNRLSINSITVKECLTICSNLLDDSFIDGLIDSTYNRITNNNNEQTEMPENMHDMTTEKLR